MPGDNRIRYALFLAGWNYKGGNYALLQQQGKLVIPSEYSQEMYGEIFCPICFTNLTRSPKEKPFGVSKINAHFRHLPSFSEVDCELRTPKSNGMKYVTEEEAKQAIANGQLAIIDSFLKDRPVQDVAPAIPYDLHAIYDIAGPVSRLPLSKHKGDVFELPSRITTVAGICRNFYRNLYKYYVFPGSQYAKLLQTSLIDVATVEAVDSVPKLYIGEIIASYCPGGNTDRNIRMTALKSHRLANDFYLKDLNGEQKRKGFHDGMKDRFVIFWGVITTNGIGLCVTKLGWGEYDLLPEKYNALVSN